MSEPPPPAQISPDPDLYWDGQTWWSKDRLYRWNGAQWLPSSRGLGRRDWFALGVLGITVILTVLTVATAPVPSSAAPGPLFRWAQGLAILAGFVDFPLGVWALVRSGKGLGPRWPGFVAVFVGLACAFLALFSNASPAP